MSRHLGYVTSMAVGASNRIVIDVDNVELKRRLYAALTEEGLSRKEWFIINARNYLESRRRVGQLVFEDLAVAEPEGAMTDEAGTVLAGARSV